jgi:membrane-bound lytic murein transglycosylase B
MKPAVTVVSLVLAGLCASQAYALSEADFQAAGRKYGVSPYLLQAIGNVESQHGELLGKYTVSEVADATQLIFLRKIARHTGRDISEFKGSYAGAMGYMQIMPSTFHAYAQDGDNDGIRDPLNPYDSLATAAYFLARTLARKDTMRAALKKYNNSEVYCDKVLALYLQLKVESQVASSQ